MKWSHYPIGEMSQANGETVALSAYISGEMSTNDIPLATWADIQTLKAGDPEPMEVIVEVPAGKSKRGWHYKPEALKAIVGEVMSQGLPGFRGHQKAENVDTEFPQPVTHWVGAKFDPEAQVKDKAGNIISKGVAYFRGVIDKSDPDLKRWIKAKTIRQVSIFGFPKLAKVAGETQVVGYKPLSIDWTPLGRAGMPTSIIATGEMTDEIAGELDGSYEELKDALREAAKALFGNMPNEYVWVRKVFDTHTIVEHESKGKTKIFSIPYGVVNDEVKLGEKTEVVRKEVYEPVGEIYGGEGNMGWKELIKQLKTMLASGDVTLGQVVGEMGLSTDALAGEMTDIKTAMDAAGTLVKVQETVGAKEGDDLVKVVGEMANTLAKTKEELGVTGEMDVIEAAKEAAKDRDEHKKATHQAMVEEVLGEKVSGEMAQALVTKMVNIPEKATKEQVAGEIDRVLADEIVKDALSKLFVDKPPITGGTKQSKTEKNKYTRVRRHAL